MIMFVMLERFRAARGSLAGVVLLALIVGYFWPLLHAIVDAKVSVFGNGIGEALVRSIGFGLALSALTTVLGALLAVATRRTRHPGPRLLTLLLLPAFLGDAMFAYEARNLFPLEMLLSDRGALASHSWLLVLQVLQHLPLAVCLYLIVFDRISQHKLDFIRATRMTATEEVRFFLMPEAAAVTVVLGIYLLFAGINCYDLPTILLRASEGTGLEFLNHALNRLYAISPMHSKAGNVMFEGATATGILLVLGWLWLIVWPRLHGLIVYASLRGVVRVLPNGAPVLTRWFVIPCLVGVATLPPALGMILGSVMHQSDTRALTFSELNVLVILRSFVATIVAAALIVTALLLASVWIRLRTGLRLRFRNFALDAGSIIAIFIGLSVPSICVALAAIFWRLTFFNSSGGAFLLLPWVMAHFAAAMPVLLFFLYIASLSVKDSVIDFSRVSRMSMWETVSLVFCDHNIRVYQLTYLLGITIIWNNTAVNTLFGPYVYPASVALHNALTSGRAIIGATTLFMVPTLMLSVLCCMTFYAINVRRGK